MNLKLAIALSLFSVISLGGFISARSEAMQLVSCAPTETQDSSSQQEQPSTNRT